MKMQSAPRCTYIRITGHACKSPALKGKNFCYFHERVIRGVATPIASRISPTFILENRESIQYALMEIMNSIANGTIDPKTASLLLRALNIAERISRRSRFHQHPRQIVQEVPNYGRQYLDEHPEYDPPAAPESPEQAAVSGPTLPPQPHPPQAENHGPLSLKASAARPVRSANWENDLRKVRASINRALGGSLPDLIDCFEAAGLTPPKMSTREALEAASSFQKQ
jgi:hypothetical protein